MARRDAPPRRTGDRHPSENELAFAQRKLEENYGKVCVGLAKWRTAFDVGQEVLVWKRPVLAALLYIGVHTAFYFFSTNDDSFLTQLSTLLFWLLVGDAIWRAASKGGQANSGTSEVRARREARRREMTGVVAFERALLLTHEQRSCQQLVPFEVVCLTLAQCWMWADNLRLALRHWSINDPLMFSLSLAVPGIILAVVGKYIPTIVLLYVLVMGVLVWPYIQYHDLIDKTSDFISTHFPVLIEKAVTCWHFIKTLMTRDEAALTEFSLVGGGGGGASGEDDTHTREQLNKELSLFMGRPVEGGRGETRESGRERGEGERERGEDGRGERREGERREVRQRAVRRAVDPGMSVLQDSVLGMTADAFHDVEDSLASFGPGTGDFPSISNFDQSLTLPQFPPEDTDHHLQHLSTIQESEEVISDDLDPLNDSADYEFGSDSVETRTSELRRRSATSHTPSQRVSTRPHPLVEYSVSAPITSYGHIYPSLDQGRGEEGERDMGGHRTPPPPYETVVSPEMHGGGGGIDYRPKIEDELFQRKGIPQSSSTPLFHSDQ